MGGEMPIPKPGEDETEEEFISRCMSDELMNEEYPDEDVRAGVCYTQWENRDKGGPKMELERKSFTGIELKADKPGAFIARIATLKVIDKDGDVTLPGAFPEGKTILISAYMHGSWMGELPVGKGVIHEQGEEVLVEGDFNLNSDTGKEHYETIKFAPDLQEWSYGFKIIDAEEDTEYEGNHVNRILKKLDVFEASPVLRGAGMNTATLAIKNDNKEGLTFTVQAEAALAAVNDLVARAKSLADLRRKEGRDLSKNSREEISRLHDGLGEIEVEIKTLLEKPEDALSESIRTELKRAFITIKYIYGGN